MTNKPLNDGGHHFDSPGGKCQKCGKTWSKHWDKDSKSFKSPCPGEQANDAKPMTIEE